MSITLQIRAARAMLGWSAADLAEKCGLTVRTIQRLEASQALGDKRAKTYEHVCKTLKAHGIEFIGDPESNPGVILHRSDHDL